MNGRRDSDDEEPKDKQSSQLLLIGVLVLAVVATGVLVLTSSPAWLRLGVLAALWAALLGAFLAARFRKQVSEREEEVGELQSVYELELEREVAARREYELEIEAETRKRVQEEGRTDLAELRAELRALRENLERLTGGEVLVERFALRAQSTRMRTLSDTQSRPLNGDDRRAVTGGPSNRPGTGKTPVRRVVDPAATELLDRMEQPGAQAPRRPAAPQPGRSAPQRPVVVAGDNAGDQSPEEEPVRREPKPPEPVRVAARREPTARTPMPGTPTSRTPMPARPPAPTGRTAMNGGPTMSQRLDPAGRPDVPAAQAKPVAPQQNPVAPRRPEPGTGRRLAPPAAAAPMAPVAAPLATQVVTPVVGSQPPPQKPPDVPPEHSRHRTGPEPRRESPVRPEPALSRPEPPLSRPEPPIARPEPAVRTDRPDPGGHAAGGRRRAEDRPPVWQAATPRYPEPGPAGSGELPEPAGRRAAPDSETTGAHTAGKSVTELLAAHANEDATRRHRRRAD